MKLNGDFCYIIWFDNLQDRNYFQRILLKKKIYAWKIKTNWDYAVAWDIGNHEKF